ncbi:MAG: hypothetical protein HW379_850 [Actinobacteria bacterium]|jgi:hypothetical protein|nr:hypothetical protein [Actinomycetota bacterium]
MEFAKAVYMRNFFTDLRNFMRRMTSGGNALFRREDGNVESSLVLIPLLILFLICMELIIATNLRNGDFAIAQGDASRRAISGEIYSTDEVIELNSPDPFAHIRVLISHRRTGLPQLVPGLIALMGGAPTTDVKGAAIMEPSN